MLLYRKTIWITGLLLMLCGMLTGCSYQNKPTDDPDKINVVTTIFPPYDFVRQVAGEQVELIQLLPPGAESHSYEPTPQDIINIRNCDVFIYVGGESDTWIKDILSSVDTEKMQLVSLMDCVDAVEEEIVPGMESDEQEDSHTEEKEYDEHVWTSPKNAILITNRITEALQKADEQNAVLYRENADVYIEELQELNEQFQEIVDHASRKTLVFGDRFPLRYFAEAYDLDYYAAFPGCAAESEPSAATISFLIKKVEEEHIPVVFHIEFSNEKVAEAICESTGAKNLEFHSCHNVSPEDLNQGATYISLMQRNAACLKEALQ